MRYQTTKDVYTFVWDYYEKHGFAPTQQEIADACFIVRSGVPRHLDRLTIWKWIDREPGKARSFRPRFPPDEAPDPKSRRKKVSKKTVKKDTTS